MFKHLLKPTEWKILGAESKTINFKFHRWFWTVSSVQSLSCVQLFATPGTAAHQASLSITNSQRLLKLMSIKSVIPSNRLILCRPLLLLPLIFPSIRIFSNELVLCIRVGQNIGVSASSSVLPMNIQDWVPLGLTGLISLNSKGLSRIFSNTTVWKHQFLGAQPSLWYNHSFDYLDVSKQTDDSGF